MVAGWEAGVRLGGGGGGEDDKAAGRKATWKSTRCWGCGEHLAAYLLSHYFPSFIKFKGHSFREHPELPTLCSSAGPGPCDRGTHLPPSTRQVLETREGPSGCGFTTAATPTGAPSGLLNPWPHHPQGASSGTGDTMSGPKRAVRMSGCPEAARGVNAGPPSGRFPPPIRGRRPSPPPLLLLPPGVPWPSDPRTAAARLGDPQAGITTEQLPSCPPKMRRGRRRCGRRQGVKV